MSEHPTTVGSINARLTLDADAFERGIREAMALADRLDGRTINVQVDADTARALAGLNAVQAAAGQTATATNAATAATNNSTAANNANANAANNSTNATNANTNATNQNNTAHQNLHRTLNNGSSHYDRHRRLILGLVALAPVAVAALGPVGGAAIGVGAALGVMGIAGVAAIVGIKREMEEGTLLGQQYAAGIQSLKGDFDILARTSAAGMLEGFDRAVDSVNGRLPFLNRLLGESATSLGNVGANLIDFLITGLQRAEPLIDAGAQSLEGFTRWLGQMAESRGFQEFVAYSTANLPSALAMLGNVVELGGRIIAAFAPLGPVVVAGLDALASALNALPLPVLAGLVTTATTAGIALQIVGSPAIAAGIGVLATKLGLVGIAANLAVPVVGILAAALAGLVVGVSAAALSQQQAVPAAQEYAAALERDANAVGAYTRELAAKKLAESGAFDAAQKLGLSIDTVTQAALGNEQALRLVNDRTKLAKNEYEGAAAAAIASQGATGGLTQAQIDQASAADLVAKAVNGNSEAIRQQQHANEQANTAVQANVQANQAKLAAEQQTAAQLGVTVAAVQNAAKSQEDQAAKTRDATLEMQLQNNAAGLLKAALDALNGKTLSAAQAQNALDSQLANMGTHVDKTGKQITFTTTSINDMSAASVALRGQLNSQVQSAMTLVQTNADLSGSTANVVPEMEALRGQIIDNAVAHGVDRDAVTQYIDKIFQIPKSVPPTKLDVDKREAELKLQGFQSAINSLTGKTVHIYTVEHIQAVRETDSATANSMVAANRYATGDAYQKWLGGDVPDYLAEGGFPGGPRGTDTVPTWLTPREFVVNRPAADQIRRDHPGALEYMNATGNLPAMGGGSGPIYLTAIIENPFTGEQVRATVRAVARDEIGNAVRDAAGLRVGA